MENYIIDSIIHTLPHFQHPFLKIMQQGCFCQGTRSKTSVNVFCGVTNSIFLWHITFTRPHFTPMRRITFFLSFRKRNVYWGAFIVWFILVCSLMSILDDYFSISDVYLPLFALCFHCPVFLTFCLASLLMNTVKETLCFWASFSYCSYRRTHKLNISCFSIQITLVNPTYVFVSINSLL